MGRTGMGWWRGCLREGDSVRGRADAQDAAHTVCGQGTMERPEPALASWERPGWPGWGLGAARNVLTGLSVTSDRVCAVEAPMGEAVRVGRTPVYLGAERE